MPHATEEAAAVSPSLRLDLAFSSHHWEAMMSRVINFDKGSKRRIKQVRWTLGEIASAALLSLALIVLGLLLGTWEVSHFAPSPKSPQISKP